jgi:hypothetical protein
MHLVYSDSYLQQAKQFNMAIFQNLLSRVEGDEGRGRKVREEEGGMHRIGVWCGAVSNPAMPGVGTKSPAFATVQFHDIKPCKPSQ